MSNSVTYIDYITIALFLITTFILLYLIANFSYKSILENINKIKRIEVEKKPTHYSFAQLYFERFLDLIISLTLYLFLLAWLIPLIGILIKLTSKGPVFFKTQRIGLYGKPIFIYKFRTMKVVDRRKIAESDFPNKKDSQFTLIGRVIKKAGLDILPSYINVLKGDMSLVGRSNILNNSILSQNLSSDEIKSLLQIKPGIISLYSISLDAIEFDSKEVAKFDLYYVQNKSVGLYLKAIFSSFIVSFGIISKY